MKFDVFSKKMHTVKFTLCGGQFSEFDKCIERCFYHCNTTQNDSVIPQIAFCCFSVVSSSLYSQSWKSLMCFLSLYFAFSRMYVIEIILYNEVSFLTLRKMLWNVSIFFCKSRITFYCRLIVYCTDVYLSVFITHLWKDIELFPVVAIFFKCGNKLL